MNANPRMHVFSSLGPHGFHRIGYTEWGDPRNNHIVVCVHALTRNSRDFDALAAELARDCRVVCMDVAGRGRSDWLTHKADYGFAVYQSDAAALLARITAPRPETILDRTARWLAPRRELTIDWVGTSMGGLIGMVLAARPNTPVRRLVLNDVGPHIPWPALLRLKASHPDINVRFASVDELERHLRQACASFGPLSDAQWRHVAQHSARQEPDGTYGLAFDPAIVAALRTGNNAGVAFLRSFR